MGSRVQALSKEGQKVARGVGWVVVGWAVELWWRTSFFHDSISCHHTVRGEAQVRAATMLRAQLIE